MWYALDATRPECLVEFGVDPDISSTHGFCSKLDDGLDSMGGPLLERPPMDTFVKMDGVLPRHDVLESRAGLASLCRSSSTPQNRHDLTAHSTFLVLFGGAYGNSFGTRNLIARRGFDLPFLGYRGGRWVFPSRMALSLWLSVVLYSFAAIADSATIPSCHVTLHCGFLF
jgi:hypothetical protein